MNSRSGLTLLEITIAMTLSIVIIVILFAALRLGYKSQERGVEKAEIMQKMRILGDRLSWLIRGAYPFFIKKPDTQKVFFDGAGDRLGFVTSSVDLYGEGPEDKAGLKWVSIYTDSKGLEIREKIFFQEDVFDDGGGKVYLLDPGVKKLEFEYFDIPEDEKQGEWVSEWDPDEKEYFPSAVKVRVTFEHNGKTVVMPELVVRLSVQKRLKS